MTDASRQSRLTYSGYLCLDQILTAQRPLSGDGEPPSHHEMFFIIVHQVYELWFKQMLHEIDHVLEVFDRPEVDERSLGGVIAGLRRVTEIQKLLLQQLKAIETLTPLDYLDFRGSLGTSSGFQSVQFRLLETKLGLKREQRLQYGGHSFDSDFTAEEMLRLRQVESAPSLFDLVEGWLERTPFVDFDDFAFAERFAAAVSAMVNEERQMLESDPTLQAGTRSIRLKMLDHTQQAFQSFLDPEMHEARRRDGLRRLSHRATLAAIFINSYRDEPILQLPYQFLTTLIDVDENLTLWRHAHSLMVLRLIGSKVGTGGSTGVQYLSETIGKHKIFSDLFNLSTLLLPRDRLPRLPKKLTEDLDFRHQAP